MDIEYRYYEVIDSTNNEAKRILEAEELSSPLVLVAKSQTAGRGRQGKTFFSPSDTGIYMTVAIPAFCPITGQVGITTASAAVVAQAIEEECRVTPSIKWVNDIYLNGGKCCGILAEAVNDYDRQIMKYAVIGVGINLETREYPEELKDIATGILDSADSELRSRLIKRVAEGLVGVVTQKDRSGYREYYISRSNVIGHDITYTQNGILRTAHAVGIDEEGGLIIEDEEGRKVLNSGEISVRVR